MNLIHSFLFIFIGLAGGIAVGSGFVAFITVLDILPRLAQISKSRTYLRVYEFSMVLGTLVFTAFDFTGWVIAIPPFFSIPMGLMMGIFIGLFAAALTEVINVLPILAKRLNMHTKLVPFLLAMVLGKIFGSLFQWLIFRVS